MEYDNIRLSEKLSIEKTHSNNVKDVFLKKGWEYCKYNNEFSKGDIRAYFYFDKIIFHFHLFSKFKKKTHHTINLTQNAPITRAVNKKYYEKPSRTPTKPTGL